VAPGYGVVKLVARVFIGQTLAGLQFGAGKVEGGGASGTAQGRCHN